jgi:hypothetical protein
MKDHDELLALVDNAAARRLWLLCNALHCVPLDGAIELARTAETFVTGGFAAIEGINGNAADELEAVVSPASESSGEPAAGIGLDLAYESNTMAKKRIVLELTADQRDRLLARLAEGAKNAELASEFRLTPKQVQGLRIGCAREIAKRRREPTGDASRSSDINLTASLEEVVRYLRQQDDIVVRQQNGQFLVNGRFHLNASDLVARANRMRSRQQKRAFELGGEAPAEANDINPTNGHPVFWGETTIAGLSER